MKIIAGVVKAPFEGYLSEVKVQSPRPEDVVVRTDYSFISNGTERHVHRQEYPEPPFHFPMVIGYQCAGQVEWVGGKVKGIGMGQRVFACRNRVIGISNSLGGAHAQRLLTAATDVIPLPDDVSQIEASALVIAQVGYNCASRIPEVAGSNVLVIGDGLIGQFAGQALLDRGFSVILSGHYDSRLRLAQEAFPKIKTVNEKHTNLEDEVAAAFNGRIDAIVNSVGDPVSIQQSIELVKKFGHVVVAGYWGGTQTIDVHTCFFRELTAHFPSGWTRQRMLATIELLRKGKMKVETLITHRFKAEDFGKACRLLDSNSEEFLGIVVDWDGRA